MKLYVVRHCSTVCSEQKIFCGRTGVPLSPRGEREAEELSRLAERLGADVVISSPSLRARQTAEAIAGDVPVLFDDRLRERVIHAYFKEMTDGEFYAYSQPNGAVEEYGI